MKTFSKKENRPYIKKYKEQWVNSSFAYLLVEGIIMRGKLTLWLYILVINTIAFIMMGMDKSKSRKGAWRISERTLFNVAFIGGSVGILGGMYIFRHKTKHVKFKWGIPLVVAIQGILLLWILNI